MPALTSPRVGLRLSPRLRAARSPSVQYSGRFTAPPNNSRSNTLPPHSPGWRSAASIAASSAQTQNDRRLNPAARNRTLYRFNRSAFFDAIIDSLRTYATSLQACSRAVRFAPETFAPAPAFYPKQRNNLYAARVPAFRLSWCFETLFLSETRNRPLALGCFVVSARRGSGRGRIAGSDYISPNGSLEATGAAAAAAISGKGVAADDGERYRMKTSAN
jgi:hypothetical protein